MQSPDAFFRPVFIHFRETSPLQSSEGEQETPCLPFESPSEAGGLMGPPASMVYQR